MKKNCMRRVFALLMVCVLAVGLLTGCVEERMEFQVNSDGTCGYGLKVLVLQEMLDGMAAVGGGEEVEELLEEFEKAGYEVTTETISGQKYYSFNRAFEFASTQELQKFMTDDAVYRAKISEGLPDTEYYGAEEAPFSSAKISKDTFIATLDTDSEPVDVSTVEDMMKEAGVDSYNDYIAQTSLTILVSVTLPDVVTESNGINSGNKVTWNLDTIPDDGKFIAVTGNNPVISSDKTAPVIKGAKNKGFYKKPVTVTASDNVSLPSVSLDGKRYNMAAFKVSSEGRHKVVATDANKNTKSVTFTIDMTKPVIKGAKNGKKYKKKVTLKFSDKYGVKTVKVNGKKSSTKKVTLKKKKRYVVKATDKAGNVTTVKFRIKK